MGRYLKFFLAGIAALVALLVLVAVLFLLLFDPNDFRDEIADAVLDKTGRELVIEGDLNVSLFPWLAIEMGKTTLGNAEGFGAEPFVSFERARLSVRVVPLLLRREVSIGAAELDTLNLSLQIKRDGTTNWADFADVDSESADDGEDTGAATTLDIAGISVTNSAIGYDNAQLGERYLLTDVNFQTGAVKPGKPVELGGGFAFRLQPDETTGRISIETAVAFEPDTALIAFRDMMVGGTLDGDVPVTFEFEAAEITLQTDERIADVGKVRIAAFDLDIDADIEPFSYADSPQPVATIDIAAFSPRALMQRLDIDAPETADPGALSKMTVNAHAVVSPRNVRMTKMNIVLDATRLTGEMTIPRNDRDAYELDLKADTIDLNRYMEPASDGGGSGAQAGGPVEIPAELIRGLHARGTLTVATATLGRMTFEKVELGVNSVNGQMRMYPLSANFFDGQYQGDIRINAAGKVPILSVNEKIQDVSLGALARAMYEQENVSGKINGTFKLEGRGKDMAEIQQTLAGNMSFVLSDGIWHGTDVWYQLRRARATFRRETPPEAVLPAQTRFSEVSASGVVTDGIMRNDDFIALLPFMRLTGRGTVNLPEATLDYALTGRLVEKPEFATAATEAELADMTRVVIPLKITGPLAAPKFAIDFGSIVKERAKEEIRDRVLDRLLGGDKKEEPPATGEQPADGEQPATEEEKPSVEDELKNRLKDLLKR